MEGGFTSFADTEFDVARFVEEQRRHYSLQEIHTNLQRHFSGLKKELVDLINNDYNDFISLSANMLGLDEHIRDVRGPLDSLTEQIEETKGVLREELAKTEGLIRERKEVQERKKCVQLFADVGSSLSKLEGLLELSPQADQPNGAPKKTHHLSFGQQRETGTRLVERVAGELVQLKFLCGRGKEYRFIRGVQERVGRVEKALQERLEAMFADYIMSEDKDEIGRCLKAYATIGLQDSAQEFIIGQVLGPWMATEVTKERLDKAGLGPLLEDCLAFYKKSCGVVDGVVREGAGVRGYDLLGRCFWKALTSTFISKLPHVFNPGIPAEFHAKYTAMVEFVTTLEGLYSTPEEVAAFRSYPWTKDFLKRWKLTIYYQLRFQEITSKVEASLAAPVEEVCDEGGLHTPAAVGVLEGLRRCVAPDVFLRPLAHRHLRLLLQVMLLYRKNMDRLAESGEQLVSRATKNESGDGLDAEVYSRNLGDVHGVISAVETGVAGDLKARLGGEGEEAPEVTLSLRLLHDSVAHVRGAVPRLEALVVGCLVAKCTDTFQHFKSVASTYRFNKETPTRHSPFVAGILAPLTEFIKAHPANQNCVEPVLESVTTKYKDTIEALLKAEQKKEESLRRLNRNAQPGESSLDRICNQLRLDVDEFGRQLAELLGLGSAAEWKSFVSLKDSITSNA